jgi:antitoxin component YwqK of YwqJK toxin-antitoxin module
MKSMKFSFFTFLIICCCQNILGQDNVNQLDQKGKKHGLWKGVYEESKRPRYEGTFEHGTETGTFTYFDDTKAGSVIATRTFSENGTVAYNIIYDQKKNIVSEGKLVNRLNEGEWKYYHEASKDLMATENYSKGKLSGIRKVFYKNHNIAEETTYLNGKKNGPYKKYTEKGVVLEESNYKNDQYDGMATYRDPDNNIIATGPYVDGLKKGLWKFYVNGKLSSQEVLPKVQYVAKPKKKKN